MNPSPGNANGREKQPSADPRGALRGDQPKPKLRPTLRLAKLMLPYKWALVACTLCVLALNAGQLLMPYVTKLVVDDFLIAKKPESGLYSITGLSLLYFGVVVVGAVCSFFQQRLISQVGQNVLDSLRRQLFAHIHRMPLKLLDKYSSGRLITRATNDVETLSEFYSDVLVSLFRDVVLLIGIVVVMVEMNAGLALVGFSTLPLILLITLLIRKRLRRNFMDIKRVIAQINGFFAENVAGMRVVQIFNRQKDKLREFDELNREDYRLSMIQVTMNSLLRPLMELVNALTISLLIAYGYRGITGQTLELGVLLAFTTYVKQFFAPINDLAEKYTSIQSALVSAERIYELLDEEEALEDLTSGTHTGPVRGKVEFRDVWFAYNAEDWVLKGVSFTVEVGEKAAFVGATGAGKSTIILLISRFYDVQRGHILVDGVDVREWQLASLRRGIAVVLQDVFLFSGTIAENVRIDSALPDEAVRRALELSQADAFVSALPGKLDAAVGERGQTFSSGERQLLSFARAIARDPAILVLDEATSDIDTQTEQAIQRAIETISQNRTGLFIAHRLSTIRACDSIFVLDSGQIRERGTHDELLAIEHGIYRKLHDAQYRQQTRLAK